MCIILNRYESVIFYTLGGHKQESVLLWVIIASFFTNQTQISFLRCFNVRCIIYLFIFFWYNQDNLRNTQNATKYNPNSSGMLISFIFIVCGHNRCRLGLLCVCFGNSTNQCTVLLFILHSAGRSGWVNCANRPQWINSFTKTTLRLWRHMSFNLAESSAVAFRLQGAIHSTIFAVKEPKEL